MAEATGGARVRALRTNRHPAFGEGLDPAGDFGGRGPAVQVPLEDISVDVEMEGPRGQVRLKGPDEEFSGH